MLRLSTAPAGGRGGSSSQECRLPHQVLERYPRGLGDLNTRRVMWQLLKAVDYIHANKVASRPAASQRHPLTSSDSMVSDAALRRTAPARAPLPFDCVCVHATAILLCTVCR